MGLYDTLEFPTEIPLPELDSDTDLSTITWQTKSIGRPAMRTFRITPDGRLLEEECHTEEVADEERPYYGTDKWDDPFFRMAGSHRRIHDGWTERQYHGIVRFIASVDDGLLEYEAKFTDGRLVALRDSSSDTEDEWIPVETINDADPTATVGRSADTPPTGCESTRSSIHTEDGVGYKQTNTRPLVDIASAYDVSIPEGSLTDTRSEDHFLQVLHLPDDRDRQHAVSGEPIAPRDVYELAIREPITIEDHDGKQHPISEIVERDGPYELETALRRAVDLIETRQLSVYRSVVCLRPTNRSDSANWATCPDCGSDEIMLVTNLDETDLTLACRTCDVRITAIERQEMFHEWIHCPTCTSGDVNVELSAPRGDIWWSCEDCGYDTMPAPIDRAYTRARHGKSSSI